MFTINSNLQPAQIFPWRLKPVQASPAVAHFVPYLISNPSIIISWRKNILNTTTTPVGGTKNYYTGAFANTKRLTRGFGF